MRTLTSTTLPFSNLQISKFLNLKTILTIALAAVAIGAQAQHRLTGSVVDNTSNAPVAYTTVGLMSADSTYVAGSISGDDGRFELTGLKAGDYIFTASFFGYEKVARPVSVPATADMGAVALSPAASAIDEVVVTAKTVQRTATGYVFSPAVSGLATGRNSMEIIGFAPGVWVDGGSIAINGRGGTRVMVNNRLLEFSGDELAAYLQSIPAEQIASIEVLPQSGPQHDASFSGGILKITLKRNTVSGLVGSAGISAATQETAKTSPYYVRPSVNLDYRTGKLSLYGSAAYATDKHFYESETTTSYLSGSQREIFRRSEGRDLPWSVTGRMGAVYEFSDKHSAGLDLDIHHMDVTSVRTSLGSTTAAGVTSALASDYDQWQQRNNRNLSFNYRWKTDDRGSNLMLFAGWLYADVNRTDVNYTEEMMPDGTADIESTRSDRPNSNDIYTAKADYTHILGDGWKLETGVKYNFIDMRLNSFNEEQTDGVWNPATELDDNVRYREGVVAAYANASAELGRWQLSAGLRAENTRLDPVSYTNPGQMKRQNYTDLFPSLNAMYAIDREKGNMIVASYSRRINRPGLGRLNPYRMQQDSYNYSVGNPNLKAYYSNEAMLTGVLKNSYSLTLLFNHEDNVIANVTQRDPSNPDVLVSMPLNVDRIVNVGAMLSFPVRFTGWWRANTDVMWDYTSNKLGEHGSVDGGRLQGRVVSVFTLPKDFGADMTYMCTTGQVYGEFRAEPMFNYLNVNVRKSFFDRKLTVSLFVNNVLDGTRRWQDGNTTYRPGVFNTVNMSNGSGLGRTYGVTLRWNFRAGKNVRVQKVEYGNSDERGRGAE